MARHAVPRVATTPSEETTRRRARYERLWIAIALLYALFRIELARQFLSGYGLNIVGFAIIELVSSPIDAVGTSRGVQALIDGRKSKAIRWFMIAVCGFVAPDAYVVVTARKVPRTLYIAVLVWAVLGIALGVRRLRRHLKRAAAARTAS